MKNLIICLFALLTFSVAQAQTCKSFLTGNKEVGVWSPTVTVTKNSWITNPYTPIWTVTVNGGRPYAIFWIQEAYIQDTSACNVIYHAAYSACLGMVSRNGTVGSWFQYNFHGTGYYFVICEGTNTAITRYSKTYYIPYKNQSCAGCQDQCIGGYSSHP